MKKLKSTQITKIKFSVLAVLLFSSIVFFSCSQDNGKTDELQSAKLRETFLKGKDFATTKTDFNNLAENEKVALWIEKLDQVLTQNISSQHKELIEQLQTELRQNTINIENVSTISIRLAEITPQDDFYKMFATLDNYKYQGHFTGTAKVNEDLQKSLKQFKFNYNKNIIPTDINGKTTGGRPCNCNWTCSLYAGGGSSNCSVTTSGCGFLWAFECEERVGPALEALPLDPEPLPIALP